MGFFCIGKISIKVFWLFFNQFTCYIHLLFLRLSYCICHICQMIVSSQNHRLDFSPINAHIPLLFWLLTLLYRSSLAINELYLPSFVLLFHFFLIFFLSSFLCPPIHFLIVFHWVVLAVLELGMQTRLDSNSERSACFLPCAGTKSMYHHAQHALVSLALIEFNITFYLYI